MSQLGVLVCRFQATHWQDNFLPILQRLRVREKGINVFIIKRNFKLGCSNPFLAFTNFLVGIRLGENTRTSTSFLPSE